MYAAELGTNFRWRQVNFCVKYLCDTAHDFPMYTKGCVKDTSCYCIYTDVF